jgi:hypothetical protein
MASAKQHERQSSYWPLIWSVIAVLAIWISACIYKMPNSPEVTFDALNALFSGLAFAALIYTVHLQREELRLQREELVLTRKELEGQKLQLQAQNDLMRSDGFESSF